MTVTESISEAKHTCFCSDCNPKDKLFFMTTKEGGHNYLTIHQACQGNRRMYVKVICDILRLPSLEWEKLYDQEVEIFASYNWATDIVLRYVRKTSEPRLVLEEQMCDWRNKKNHSWSEFTDLSSPRGSMAIDALSYENVETFMVSRTDLGISFRYRIRQGKCFTHSTKQRALNVINRERQNDAWMTQEWSWFALDTNQKERLGDFHASGCK